MRAGPDHALDVVNRDYLGLGQVYKLLLQLGVLGFSANELDWLKILLSTLVHLNIFVREHLKQQFALSFFVWVYISLFVLLLYG